MNILLWIILGGIAGWLASIVMRTDSRQGIFGDILLGVVGAVVGGFIATLLGAPGVTGFNLYSLLISVLGAALLIYLGRSLYRHT
jgi:uncharacterized membrane protein YeaQ/YmgE (transglycosylase-associated protein family)